MNSSVACTNASSVHSGSFPPSLSESSLLLAQPSLQFDELMAVSLAYHCLDGCCFNIFLARDTVVHVRVGMWPWSCCARLQTPVPWTARLEVVSEERVEFRVTATSRGRSVIYLHHEHHAGLRVLTFLFPLPPVMAARACPKSGTFVSVR